MKTTTATKAMIKSLSCNIDTATAEKIAKAINDATEMTYKAAQEDPRFVKLSEGNKKLVPTEKVKFLIFNIPAIITCPFATKHCKAACYAIKPERHRKNVRIARARNFAESQLEDFTERMAFTIAVHMNRKSYQAARKVVVRIHESGDFYSKEYAEKWLEIVNTFAGYKTVVFMAYTKSVDFFKGEKIPKNMVLRFSLWDDTDPAQYAIAKEMELPIYTAVDRFTSEPKKNRCRCESCATCGKCWSAIATLLCEIH